MRTKWFMGWDKPAAMVLAMIMVLTGVVPVGAWEITSGPLAGLTSLEKTVYGKEEAGPILQRIDMLEKDLLGGKQDGPIVARLERLNAALRGPGDSLLFRLNALEWYLTRTLSGGALNPRLTQVEQSFSCQVESGPLGPRLERLAKLVWVDGKASSGQVQLEKGTLVMIKLGTELSSQSTKTGDKVKFQVAQDVKVDGKLIIPAGVAGEGRVTEVVAAANLGRDGRVRVNFGSIAALDGQPFPIEVDEKATEMNKSLQFAAGAAMAGVLLLGPVGLVGGYFVKGKDVVIPIGTEFFVSITASSLVTGLAVSATK
jgi:hypothetical protein